jgi:transcription elongation GreA/GreB family factor
MRCGCGLIAVPTSPDVPTTDVVMSRAEYAALVPRATTRISQLEDLARSATVLDDAALEGAAGLGSTVEVTDTSSTVSPRVSGVAHRRAKAA